MKTLDFLKRFRSDNSKIEFSVIGQNGATVIDEKHALSTKHHNVYFLSGVRSDLIYGKNNRAKDIDITEKNYLVIDIDARNNLKAYDGSDCTDDDIITLGEMLSRNLSDLNEFLGDFDFIIYSGNGIHVYYLGDFINISPDDYYYALQRIMKKWDDLWGNSLYACDKACKNIARIIRLPGSVNQKNGKEVKVISERQGKGLLVSALASLAAAEKEEEKIKKEIEVQNQVKEYQIQQKMNKVIYKEKYEDNAEKLEKLFQKINNVPAYLVAQKFLPDFPISKNGKNFENEKGGFTGYYYIQELNTICNGGSRYFNWGDESSNWSSSLIVKHRLDCSWGEVIAWFSENFKIKI